MDKKEKQEKLIKQEIFFDGCIKAVSEIYEMLKDIKPESKEQFTDIMLDVLLKYRRKIQNEKHINFLNHFNNEEQ